LMKGILKSYFNNILLRPCQVELRRAELLPIAITSCSDLPRRDRR
jgi:hypothetical protein